MNIQIKPSFLSGKIKAPASKSMAHRLLICAGLAEGESYIKNVAYSQDILATLDCLEALGAKVTRGEDYVKISGVNPENSSGGVFNCRESGSTLRFFIPLAMLSREKSLFTGSKRLMERPMEIYESLAKEKGSFYEKTDEGIRASGPFEGGEFFVRGDISSQFITGLLFALPFLKKDSRITLTGKAESLAYIDMTIEAQRLFGVNIIKEKETVFFIKGNQRYTPKELTVEGDYSNAAFLEAINCLGGKLEISGLTEDSLQGDRIYREYFGLLKNGTPVLDVSGCPDLAPILMTLACYFSGAELIGTRRLKIKESDRGEVMKTELSKFGASIFVGENNIKIEKVPLRAPREALSGNNDHRVVMSLSVLLSRFGGIIEGAEAVEKSYPDFFLRMKEAGMEVTAYGD